MKYFNIVFFLGLLIACKPKVEFYINGKPYYTNEVCIDREIKPVWAFFYGYNVFNGKYEYHYGPTYEVLCHCMVIDTIEIK